MDDTIDLNLVEALLKLRKGRTRYTAQQRKRLHQVFERTTHPTTVEKTELAIEFGITYRQITIWFQNKRSAMRKNTLL